MIIISHHVHHHPLFHCESTLYHVTTDSWKLFEVWSVCEIDITMILTCNKIFLDSMLEWVDSARKSKTYFGPKLFDPKLTWLLHLLSFASLLAPQSGALRISVKVWKLQKNSKIWKILKVSKNSNITKISEISKSILKSAVLPASPMPLS